MSGDAAVWRDWLVRRFWWDGYDFVKSASTAWPNFAATGFLTSYGAVLLGMPLVLTLVLYCVWSLAAVGPARKTLSTVLILTLGVPLYPVLAGLSLLTLWVVIAFATLALSTVGPLFLAIGTYTSSCTAAGEFVSEQRRQEVVQDDITFCQMCFGLLMGAFTMCTFGVATVALTSLKSPLVYVAALANAIYYTVPPLLEAGLWCPLAFLGWTFGFAAGAIVLVPAIAISVLVKLLLTALWPAYISAGWLRYFGGGGQRRDQSCCTPVVQGIKAGYQVFWAADILTNACVRMRFDLLKQTLEEFQEIASGSRERLSDACSAVACFPPVVVGLYQGASWNMAERAVARDLGVSTDVVRQAWRSLKDQMVRVGREALAEGLLTEDYILGVPPELVIGLPARVLLDTVERSPDDELLLADGLVLTESQRPRGPFSNRVWAKLSEAQKAFVDVRVTSSHDDWRRLRASLLAGGGEPSELPGPLQQAVLEFCDLPQVVLGGLTKVQLPLIGVAVECSRERLFKEQLEEVFQKVTEQGDYAPLASSSE